jgi:anti-anti-sigma regulatory factor
MRSTFSLEQHTVDSVTIFYLVGPLRLGACETTTGMHLSDAVKRLPLGTSHLIAIDLRGLVKTPDSSGLGELVAAETALRRSGRGLVLVNVPRKLRDLIATMRLEPLFRIVDTEEDAVALIRGSQ